MRSLLLLTAVASATLVIACGGGSGTTTTTTTSGIRLTGTAAAGYALAGATVTVKCASGTATATAAADGQYAVTLATGQLPCVVEATGLDASNQTVTYHSAVTGTAAGTYTVNVTPLTELVMAQVAAQAVTGGTPATLFSSFGTTPALTSAVTGAALDAGVTYLRNALGGVVDLSAVNPLTDPLSAAHGSTAGNDLDGKIDTVMAQLVAKGTTLPQLVSTVGSNPSAPAVVATATATTANCPWIRSGTHRMLSPYNNDPQFRIHDVSVDLVNMAVSVYNAAGTLAGTLPLVPMPNTPCSFTMVNGSQSNHLVISTSGIGLITQTDTVTTPSTLSTSIVLPAQTLALSDLAGTYNEINFNRSTGATLDHVDFGTTTLNAQGQVTGSTTCVDTAACTADAGPFGSLALTATSLGGFDFTNSSGTSTARVYAYKAPAGNVALFALGGDGSAGSPFALNVLTRQRALSLPSLPLTIKFWDHQINGDHTQTAQTAETLVVSSVDAAASSVTRTRQRDGRVDTRTFNSPRPGLVHRAPNTCVNANGTTNCAGLIAMPLEGMGMTVIGSLQAGAGVAANSRFIDFSVGTP